jgi:hypothetical protein
MTEAEWDACADPEKMVVFLGRRTSRRKLRWFACACCRRLWEHLKDEDVRKALDRAERYADGHIRNSTADRWYHRACRSRERQETRSGFTPEWMACHAVASAVLSDRYAGMLDVHRHVARAVADRTGERRGSPAWEAARRAASRELVPVLREVVGNPFRPVTVSPAWLSWNDAAVVRLARAAYEAPVLPAGKLDNARLAVLADALEEAGCGDEQLLRHLRSGGEHFRGCFVVDALLGRS